jgi:hypothetical protein
MIASTRLSDRDSMVWRNIGEKSEEFPKILGL